MSKKSEKAVRAVKLRGSLAFKEFHQDVMNEQAAIFANPSSTPDEIVEAHSMVRALTKITSQMARATLDHKLEKRTE